MTKIREALEQMVKKHVPIQVIAAEVVAVNEGSATCDCNPSDGGPTLYDVRIRATIDDQQQGIIILPEVGSSVLVGSIQNNPNQSFVLLYSEISKVVIHCTDIQLNGDGFGALIKINELVQKINRLEQAIIQHQHSYASPGGPAITTVAPNTPSLVSPQTTVANLANNNVKHG